MAHPLLSGIRRYCFLLQREEIQNHQILLSSIQNEHKATLE